MLTKTWPVGWPEMETPRRMITQLTRYGLAVISCRGWKLTEIEL